MSSHTIPHSPWEPYAIVEWARDIVALRLLISFHGYAGVRPNSCMPKTLACGLANLQNRYRLQCVA